MSNLIEEAFLQIECVKKEKIEFGYNTLFIGKVVYYNGKDGNFRVPLAYDERNYTCQTEEIIKF